MTTSLYERLGGTEGITRIASDVVDNHCTNPRISKRFANVDIPALKASAAAFFITGTGGPQVYEGQDMETAHTGMNIDVEEFVAVLDDALAALQKNEVGQRAQEEVLFVLYSMKGMIVHQ
ncbi:group 1 truncated hemoglobin [Corallincola platygyrae]|uniref:Group 1 truncated hemoglobin n=1 Tax=Corallincola platygyrae TaxID=1193278 RepID=A0ABW4XPV2_9GAMM